MTAHLERASQILDILLEDAFKEPNVKICVHDGEDTTTCVDAQTAKTLILDLDESCLEIRTREFRSVRLAWFLLIPENDHEIITDYSDNATAERIAKRALEKAEEMGNVT